MDAPIKLYRKYKTYVPRKSGPGLRVDWEALAKSRNFFNNSAYEMFKQLYANTEEDFKAGKMSVIKLAEYLSVEPLTLSKALREYGFDIKSKQEKLKYNKRNRTKYSFPYICLGFDTELKMWEYFIENNIATKEIIRIIYEKTGKCFLYKAVYHSLYRVKKSMSRNNK